MRRHRTDEEIKDMIASIERSLKEDEMGEHCRSEFQGRIFAWKWALCSDPEDD